MTSPAVARLLVAAPAGPVDAEAVAALLEAYRPAAVFLWQGEAAERDAYLAAEAAAAAVVAHLGLPVEPVAAARPVAEALGGAVRRSLGQTVVVLLSLEAVTALVAHALGVDPGVAAIPVLTGAVSVLQADEDGRWAVIRLNEGALPHH